MIKNLDNTLFGDFLSLFFPDLCLCCNESLMKGEKQVCTKCRYELPQTNYHLAQENVLAQRFWGKLPVQYTLAYLKFTKGGRVQKILHELKYNNNQEVGEMMGRWYGQILADANTTSKDTEGILHASAFDLILPVPLHRSKLRQRGYNQSDCFAQGLSASTNIPWRDDVLKRKKATKTQTKKGRMGRWQNVEKIFEVQKPEVISEKHVLLVDDVITTGSTLEACAQAILEAGAQEISIATIAVAV